MEILFFHYYQASFKNFDQIFRLSLTAKKNYILTIFLKNKYNKLNNGNNTLFSTNSNA